MIEAVTSPPLSSSQSKWPESAEEPVITLRPESRWDFLNFKEVLGYRDLLTSLATRDVKLRYRQTALGVIWVVFQPLLGAGLFQVVFGLLAKTPSDGVPPFAFYYAGFMAYKTFENTISKSSGSLVQNSHLVSKVYFPRVILPFSTVYSTLVDFGVAFVVMLVLMASLRIAPTWAFLLLPLWLALIQMLALGFGLVAAALTVTYRDVQYALPVLIQFGLYASPVAYPVSYALTQLPSGVKPLLFLNPLTGLLDTFRWSLLGTGVYSWTVVAYAAAATLIIFAWGLLSFNKMERNFADVI